MCTLKAAAAVYDADRYHCHNDEFIVIVMNGFLVIS